MSDDATARPITVDRYRPAGPSDTLGLLAGVSRILAEAPGLAEAASGAIREICQAFGWAVGALWLVDQGSETIRCVCTWHPSEDGLAQFAGAPTGMALARGAGLPGRVWEIGEPLWVGDLASDEYFQRKENAAAAGLRSAFVLPLIQAGQTLGILEFFSRDPRSPDPPFEAFAVVIANQLVQLVARMRAEERMGRSEARGEAFIQSALDCVITMDRQGRIVEFNPSAERTFGYPSDRVVGMPMADLLIPERYRAEHRAGLSRYLATGEGPILGRRLELTGLRADGTEFPIELSVIRVPLPGPPLFMGYVRDITDRRQDEASLSRMAALVESSDDAIIGKDLDGTILSWNRGAEKMYGYTAAEAVGRPISLLAPPDRMEEMPAILERIRQGHSFDHHETRRMTKDGRILDVSTTISPVRDADGNTVGASAIARDITERKRLEEEGARLLERAQAARAEAERARDRLAFLAEASQLLGSSLDYETTLARVADLAVPRISDWCSIDVLSEDGSLKSVAVAHKDPEKVAWARELQSRYPPPDMDAPTGVPNVLRTGESELYPDIPDEMLVAAVAESKVEDKEEVLRILRELGMTSIMVVPLLARERALGAISFVSAESGIHYDKEDLGLAEELARRAAQAIDNARLFREARAKAREVLRLNQDLEARIADRTSQLEQANSELEGFSYSVSHDLRAPLRVIDGFSKILVEEFGPHLPEDAARYLEVVREGAQQMGQLIDELLAYARLGRRTLKRERVDVAHMIDACLEQLQPEFEGRQVEVTVADLPPCQGDPVILKQVFMNLLSNALKFTRPAAVARIEVGFMEDSGLPAYFVRDNGVGFDMAYADKLFGVFQRLHRADDFEGTGVGLAIVQRGISRHGGRVWAEAQVDAGATFYVAIGEGDEE